LTSTLQPATLALSSGKSLQQLEAAVNCPHKAKFGWCGGEAKLMSLTELQAQYQLTRFFSHQGNWPEYYF